MTEQNKPIKQIKRERIPRKLKKQLKKLEVNGKTSKTPKEKKKLPKKSTTVFPRKTPKLPTSLLNKKHYLYLRKYYNAVFVNYDGVEDMLLTVGKITEKNLSKNSKIVNNYLALFKFVGLNPTNEELDFKFQLLKSKKRKNYRSSRSNSKENSRSVVRKKNHKNKAPRKPKPIKSKWRKKNNEILPKRTDKKTPLWVSDDIVSQVEEKHYFISSAYREISQGSDKLDFYMMKLALQKSNIIMNFTKNASHIIERYVIFYSFVGIYTDSYELDAKISNFERHQQALKEELMKKRKELIQFSEIEEMVSYFKRDPNKISKKRVLEYTKVLKQWKRISDEQDISHPFIVLLEELINNISVLMAESKKKNKKPKNYGKIIHLTGKMKEIEKPEIRQAV